MGGQGERGGPADAVRRPGDEGDLPGELHPAIVTSQLTKVINFGRIRRDTPEFNG